MISHIGTETWPNLFLGGSSEEFWTMNESLIQQYHVNDEGLFFFIVKFFQ